jgi:DNA-binding NtrC family response regulator
MPNTLKGVRFIVLAVEDLEITLRQSIEVLEAAGDFANSPAELSSLIHKDTAYQVAILPAKPVAGSWLSICHDISALKPPPAILVYSDQFSFELWTQVLDGGGFDLIVEPLTAEKLQSAVLGALNSQKNGSVDPGERDLD